MRPGFRSALWPVVLGYTGLAAAFGSMGMYAQTELPQIKQVGERHELLVNGKPYLMLGAQINNSSSWASTLPQVWPALQDLHVNTVEAPVYWETMEPKEGTFDFSGVDVLLQGARAHNLKLVLLWFGSWKNGQNHYVPAWVKSDLKRFPREISARGKVLDVMSPSSEGNLAADKKAFAALLRHVHEADAQQGTVIMVQVENESGTIGTVRDHSRAANEAFARPVPHALAEALHRPEGSWEQVFGADADERFEAYTTARYINEVARAGKAEYKLPMYCNVWITYPVHALANRDQPSPGQEYPSGGPQQGNVDVWKAAAPEIDVLAPDFYSNDLALLKSVVKTYARPDNALLIPETGATGHFGQFLYYALGHGAIGFSPFGVDYTGWMYRDNKLPASFTEDYAALAPMAGELAQAIAKSRLRTAVEEPGNVRGTMRFGDVEAVASFGFPQRDGEMSPGTKDDHGRALVMQTGPLEYVVTGVDASVSFQLGDNSKEQLEILTAEEGHYEQGVWKMTRIWNGDQTDRGLRFPEAEPAVVRIRLHRIPLMAAEAKR